MSYASYIVTKEFIFVFRSGRTCKNRCRYNISFDGAVPGLKGIIGEDLGEIDQLEHRNKELNGRLQELNHEGPGFRHYF